MSMQLVTRVLLLAAPCLTGTSAALAVDALKHVPIPSEFGVHAMGDVDPVVYTELSGELINPMSRHEIEATCQVALESGQIARLPLFEAGDDKPVKTETKRFTNAKHWANYTVNHMYVCDRPAGRRSSSAEAMCDCTYRVIPQYYVQIKNKTAAGLEIIKIDVNKRTAQRYVMPGPVRGDLERGAADVLGLAPEIVGKDVVAGIPCVMRRRSMGDKSYMDICITEDPDKRLPAEMRYRTLSEYMPNPSGKGAYQWSKVDKIVLDGAVDSAVFAIPEGFAVKELK